MKGTDFAIVFLMFFIPFAVLFDFRLSMTAGLYQQKIMLNNIFDTAAEDAVYKSFTVEGDNAYIDYSKASKAFIAQAQKVVDVDGDDFPVMLVTHKDGFWIGEEDNTGLSWHPYQKSQNRQEKIEMIREEVERKLNTGNDNDVTVSIPVIEAQEWYNTVTDCGMLVIYKQKKSRMKPLGSRYTNYIVSGASVHKKGQPH